MNETIVSLKSTPFAGRRFTRKQLLDIQKTINAFPDLSHRELGLTTCEHLNWETAGGSYKIQTCLNALTEMQAVGLFSLPKKLKKAKGTQKALVWTPRTIMEWELNNLHILTCFFIRLRQCSNSYVDCYAPVGTRTKTNKKPSR